jgi:hypothetical protein
MNKQSHRICAHTGLWYCAIMCLGIFIIAGWLPPTNPARTADDIAQLFIQDQTRIRVGMSFLAFASVLYWPFSAAISGQLRRIEGQDRLWSTLQMAAAAGTVVAALIPAYIWLALAYRPELTPPSTLQLLNDFAWLSFVGMYPPAVVQNVAIGLCILSAPPERAVYPRWIGFFCFWIAVCYLVGALIAFFKVGPFAWNGLFGFWVAAVSFFGWTLVLWRMTLRAIEKS